jgi:hypothetical protein
MKKDPCNDTFIIVASNSVGNYERIPEGDFRFRKLKHEDTKTPRNTK